MNYYKVLGIEENATQEEIRQAYEKQVKLFKLEVKDEKRLDKFLDLFKEAYDALIYKEAIVEDQQEEIFDQEVSALFKNNKINTELMFKLDTNNTTFAFVSLMEDGERDFSFYRNPSADMLLNAEEIEEEVFAQGGILHFCSVSLIDAPIKEAHRKAIEFAKRNNCLISFDPNVRLPLWETPEACREAILEFLPFANIVKISDEELEFITGIADETEALNFLLQGDVEVIIYTKGTNGAEFITKERKVFSPSFKVEAQDTTGAGDSFIGSFLYQVAEGDNTLESLVNLPEEKVKEILTFSNATAALTVCKRGAIGALPTKEEVLTLAQGR